MAKWESDVSYTFLISRDFQTFYYDDIILHETFIQKEENFLSLLQPHRLQKKKTCSQ